ncbi:MAG: ATPase, T2SS/T4P/T4SS family [Candidatus Aenigmatarchaeota archaeon]
MNLIDWYTKLGWNQNPFTFEILPQALVGYKEQINQITTALKSRQKILLVIGPTGSGKTTFLKWLTHNMLEYDFLFLGKPPETPEELIFLLNLKYKPFFWSKLESLYQIPSFLAKRKPLVIICDEAHETEISTLEWIRVLSDQTPNLHIIFSALPVFENKLRTRLETLRKRIASRVELLSITKEEMVEMIRKRIIFAGGTDALPFTNDAIDHIFNQSGGFPREIIRISNNLINRAAELDKDMITPDILEKPSAESDKINVNDIPDKQKQILEILLQPMTTHEIVEQLGLETFKSKTHGLRAINNILKRLLELGYVERSRKNRNFVYTISPRLQTIFVKA